LVQNVNKIYIDVFEVKSINSRRKRTN